MVALKRMVVTAKLPGTAGEEKYFFKSNPLLYAGISSVVGIAEAQASDKKVDHRVEDLLLYGVLIRKAVTVGTGINRKQVKILCSISKAETVEAELLQKTIPQGTITSISADLRSENFLP